MSAAPLVLALESSCDESSVAIVRGQEVLCNLVSSQVPLHRRFGGVVPEVASRQHVLAMEPLIRQAVAEAGVGLEALDAVAATFAPGLMGALLVGLVAGKGLAWALDKPFIGVHHLEAHLWAAKMAEPDLPPSFLGLLVSGGHTSLVRVDGADAFTTLGATIDDAAGEAFDKVGRMLGLPYPGGPEIDRLAPSGQPKAFAFPRAWLDGGLDFSFAGLKTAVRRAVEKHEAAGLPLPVADLAASFQAAVVEVLVTKALQAARQEGLPAIALAGGVAANRGLRAALGAACAQAGLRLALPPMDLCTDNAAMIAGLAAERLRLGLTDPLSLAPAARLPLGAPRRP